MEPHHKNECKVCLIHQIQEKAGSSRKKLNFDDTEIDRIAHLFYDSTLQIPSHPLAVNIYPRKCHAVVQNETEKLPVLKLVLIF